MRIMRCIGLASDGMSDVVETSHAIKAICHCHCIYARIHSRMIIVVANRVSKRVSLGIQGAREDTYVKRLL